ncbi:MULTISPECIES: hypothetical protein [unclassified Sutcliffiella]|uniref:hypothetical protein n=1 Tax=unclassified Sutcliffiella TaxID=2837532 RepID=UPI0030D391C9
MYLLRVVLMFAIFLLTVQIHVDHSTPNNILAIYEKSFYFEMENAPLNEKLDDDGISGTVSYHNPNRKTFISLIPEQPYTKLNFHLVTVFYQGSYI